MNYGPLEFADYLQKDAKSQDSATVRAARAAQPARGTPVNLLRVVSHTANFGPPVRGGHHEPMSVFEAVAVNPLANPDSLGAVSVTVQPSQRPLILVLSSHQPVLWRLTLLAEANLRALMLSGFGRSMVVGAGNVAVHRIGGFYAFKRGSAEYRHLQSEVQRCTGGSIGYFQSLQVGSAITL